MQPAYKRVLIKISGEALMGKQHFGLELETVEQVAEQLKSLHKIGVQVCIVVGGGNIFRGISGAAKGMDRATADTMGMIATVINALALQNNLENVGIQTRVQTAVNMPSVAEPFIRRRAIRHMEKGRVVIFAGGTGNPFFTTDTAAALRASEMGCDALLKATKVDGIYTADPRKDAHATHIPRLSYMDVLTQDLKVMDASAIALCRENKIPILVFSMTEKDSFANVVQKKGKFSIVEGENMV